ncbi:MAG: serine/threonine protein kinase [Candidatus Hydrogenedentes bacterium]|nr:serine/threonine protein kinase [Candidatus Hydrogenedentota bacterium]
MNEWASEEARRIGKYAILRELGRGGMGVVYLARDTDLDREVALKMVQPSLARDERSLARFKKEARAVAALSHPNIVHINALTEIDELLLIEMPFLPGGSLRDTGAARPSPAIVAHVLDRMLDALGRCHERGIIHRDVKPSNILFDADGVPKLTDFGAVALMESEWAQARGERTLTMTFSGTPQYCCPEAWDGQPPTPRWDLYALGMVARDMLSAQGIRPVTTPLAHIRQLLESEEPPIRELVPDLSEAFAELVDRLTSRDPDRRPASAGEALAQLRDTPEFVVSASADAHTINLPGPMRGLTSEPSSIMTRGWRRIRRPLRRAAPWLAVLLVAVFWAVEYATRAPVMPPDAESAQTGRAARAPSQRETFETAAPAASAIPLLRHDSVLGRSGLYTLRTARQPASDAHFVFRRQPGDDRLVALGLLGGQIHYLELEPPAAPGGAYTMTGFSGDYTPASAPLIQLSRIRGEAEWDGNFDAPMWLALRSESEIYPESWSDAVLAVPYAGPMTDTAVVMDWEAHPTALPFFLREIVPRHPRALTLESVPLPSIAGARLVADAGGDARDLSGAESLAAAADRFTAVLPGRPHARGSWLAADHDGARARFVIAVPDADRALIAVDLCILPRYHAPREDSPFFHVYRGESGWRAERIQAGERAPIDRGWSAATAIVSDGHLATIEFDLTALGLEAPPLPQTWIRVNASAEQEARGGDAGVHIWGWPEVEAAWRGALVELRR